MKTQKSKFVVFCFGNYFYFSNSVEAWNFIMKKYLENKICDWIADAETGELIGYYDPNRNIYVSAK